MPYCPKCDMEFVEGVAVCTDCGSPLYESKEAADAALKEEKEKQMEEMLRLQEEYEAEGNESGEDTAGEKNKKVVPTTAYVNKEQRYEDMSSSASAFFIVGGVLAVAAVLTFAGIIPLPMSGFSKYMFQGLIAVMAVGSLLIAVSSKKSAGVLKSEAAVEKQETDDIINWFTANYTADSIDSRIFSEDPELSGEELSLKRFELIQDLLVTGKDLPDPSYVDSLSETIYSRLFDNN